MQLVSLGLIPWIVIYSVDSAIQHLNNRGQILLSYSPQGWIQFFFLGGGALVSCSTSTPINHIVFFFCRIPVVLENCRSSQGGGGGVQPLHPPPRSTSAPDVVIVHVTHVSDGPNPLRKPFIGKDFFGGGRWGTLNMATHCVQCPQRTLW